MKTSMARRTPAAHCTSYEPQTCTTCNGGQGQTVTEVDADGTFRQHWQPCGTCHGSGVR